MDVSGSLAQELRVWWPRTGPTRRNWLGSARVLGSATGFGCLGSVAPLRHCTGGGSVLGELP